LCSLSLYLPGVLWKNLLDSRNKSGISSLAAKPSHITTHAPCCNFWAKELQGNELIKNHHKVLAKKYKKQSKVKIFAVSFKMYKKCKKCCSSGKIASLQAGSFLLNEGTSAAVEILLP